MVLFGIKAAVLVIVVSADPHRAQVAEPGCCWRWRAQPSPASTSSTCRSLIVWQQPSSAFWSLGPRLRCSG
jgi:hypothetical protein